MTKCLFGQVKWHAEFYPSGTTIVTSRQPGMPHLYVYGPAGGAEHDDGNRMKMCHDLAEFMSGGNRPLWLDDMERVSENGVRGMDRSEIFAVGPSYDAEPPKCAWRELDTPEARKERAVLIDCLMHWGNA